MRLLLQLYQPPDLRPPLISVPVERVLEGQRIELIVVLCQGQLYVIPEPRVIAAEQGLPLVGTPSERRLQGVVELILNVIIVFIGFFDQVGLFLHFLICLYFVHFLYKRYIINQLYN